MIVESLQIEGGSLTKFYMFQKFERERERVDSFIIDKLEREREFSIFFHICERERENYTHTCCILLLVSVFLIHAVPLLPC